MCTSTYTLYQYKVIVTSLKCRLHLLLYQALFACTIPTHLVWLSSLWEYVWCGYLSYSLGPFFQQSIAFAISMPRQCKELPANASSFLDKSFVHVYLNFGYKNKMTKPQSCDGFFKEYVCDLLKWLSSVSQLTTD